MTGVDGVAAVDLCGDRVCMLRLGTVTVDKSGSSGVPDAELPAGPVFWRVRAGATMSATWEFFVGSAHVPADLTWGATLDVDGDGIPDVAAGASASVAVWLGGLGFGAMPVMLANPDAPGAKFGYVVAAAGDLDGDGYGELAVGECGSGGGKVHVYFGAPGGALGRVQALSAPDNLTGFGCRLTAAGDLDGDGYGDLVIARTGDDFGGGIYVVRGAASGKLAVGARIDSPDYKPSRLGYSLAGVGDLDGDGFADLVATEIDASAASGRAHVYRGGPDGITNARQTTIQSPDPSGLQFGASVAGVGDVDGDGYPDFVVAAPAVSTTTLAPAAHLYRGGPSGLMVTPTTLATDGSPGFATEVEPAGDVDGDGLSDVLVTATDSVVLFRGAGAGIIPAGTLTAAGQGVNPRHAAGAGDLDRDGHADVLVADGAGVEVLFGTGSGLARTRAVTLTPPGGSTGSVN